MRVAAPGGRRQLDDLIGAIASTALDRSRPLWQLYYAEGLADRRIAVIGKVHHVLADGVASANLMALAMKWPGAVPPRHGPSVSTRSTTATDIMRSACCDHLRRIRRLPSAIKDGVAGAYRLERQARRRSSHPELADQFNPPRTFLNHKVSPGRTFASASLSLADVKEISKKLDATINDLVLAVRRRPSPVIPRLR